MQDCLGFSNPGNNHLFTKTIDVIRADSVSYTYDFIKYTEKVSKRIFAKTKMTEAQEREFDVLKNDFGRDNMPFSRLE